MGGRRNRRQPGRRIPAGVRRAGDVDRGFNGTDPTPKLAEFEKYVAAGDIHYFIAGGRFGGFGGGSGGGAGAASDIESWVTDTFQSRTVDGVAIYDLAASKG